MYVLACFLSALALLVISVRRFRFNAKRSFGKIVVLICRYLRIHVNFKRFYSFGWQNKVFIIPEESSAIGWVAICMEQILAIHGSIFCIRCQQVQILKYELTAIPL